ncbi:enoyl-CoA hydratase [Blastococcus sp. TF02A-26]|nr:enoyl-CoA hydratase [Blastococcus sp. TF02A-26]
MLVVTINRPEVRNAVDGEVHMTIGRLLDEVDADPDVRVVVVTGAGDQAFSAGADLKATARGETVLPPGFEHWGFAGWVRHPISTPTIAAVNGAAMGGGAELLLSCDLAVAAEHAVIGLPEVKVGMVAADGGPFRALAQLPQRIGMELVLTGEPITAARALELHLVNRVVPGDQLMDTALELAGRIAANAPLAVRASKRIALGLRDGERPGERLHWDLTREAAHAIAGSADAEEGVRAFLEKRPPHWTGR